MNVPARDTLVDWLVRKKCHTKIREFSDVLSISGLVGTCPDMPASEHTGARARVPSEGRRRSGAQLFDLVPTKSAKMSSGQIPTTSTTPTSTDEAVQTPEPHASRRGLALPDVSPPPPLQEMLAAASETGRNTSSPELVPPHRDRVWTFLMQSNKSILRRVCKEYNVVQKGKKETMALRAFQRLCIPNSAETLWSQDVTRGDGRTMHTEFEKWQSTQDSSTVWEVSPSSERSTVQVKTLLRKSLPALSCYWRQRTRFVKICCNAGVA